MSVAYCREKETDFLLFEEGVTNVETVEVEISFVVLCQNQNWN